MGYESQISFTLDTICPWYAPTAEWTSVPMASSHTTQALRCTQDVLGEAPSCKSTGADTLRLSRDLHHEVYALPALP